MTSSPHVGPDVDLSKISPDAVIGGATYITGSGSVIEAGAYLMDARVHNGVVESGARLIDSILVSQGQCASHKCDTAGRVVVGGAETPRVGDGAEVSGCTLINVAVDCGTRVTDTWAQDAQFGKNNNIRDAKIILVQTGDDVTVTGPTEISEAYLGWGATIDRRGYYEGVFCNAMPQLSCDDTGRLSVTGVIELPHVSRYGLHTINSTNSGKLLPQPDQVLKGFGPHLGLWVDPLLSHEQIRLGPCCWVAPWTKVIGQSPSAHSSDDEMVNDDMMTYIMPFAAGGVSGDQTRGLVMPGELSWGLGTKQRRGAWTFTYAPGAVVEMVAVLHDALPEGRKAVADTIVAEALRTALEMTRAMAIRRGVDLDIALADQRPGWPRWIANTWALLRAHLDNDLWLFEGGKPVGWTNRSEKTGKKWTHEQMDKILALAPDALENQMSVEAMFASDDPVPPSHVAVRFGQVAGSGSASPSIDPAADVSPLAQVGPGCRLGAGVVVRDGAVLWNSVLEDCEVGTGAQVERSVITGGSVGPGAVVRSCDLNNSVLGADSLAESARAIDCTLADHATVSSFADLRAVRTEFGSILGGTIDTADIGANFMAMHMAGACSHLQVVPTEVQLDGITVGVPAVPMIGGGSQIRGTAEAPVRMECCFVGSNSVIEAGSFIGFGCFLLGTLEAGSGLLPLTVSTGGGVGRHQIGGALGSLSSTVITHFVNWTYQAVGADCIQGVAEMVRQSIARGIDAIIWEQSRRSGDASTGGDGRGEQDARYACFRTMSEYSDSQLEAGLKAYRQAQESGAWEMAFADGQLRFTSDKGRWTERGGTAFWQKNEA